MKQERDPPTGHTYPHWLERFLHHLRHERRLSSHTVAGYQRDLTRFGSWLEATEGIEISHLGQQQIRAYVAWHHRHGASG